MCPIYRQETIVAKLETAGQASGEAGPEISLRRLPESLIEGVQGLIESDARL